MAITKTTFVAHSSPAVSASWLNALQDEIIQNCVTADQVKTFGDTQKANARSQIGAVSSADVATAVGNAKVIVFKLSSITMRSYSTSDNSAIANVTSNHTVVEAVFSNPGAMASDLTVTTGSASVTLQGTMVSGQNTDLTLKLLPLHA